MTAEKKKPGEAQQKIWPECQNLPGFLQQKTLLSIWSMKKSLML